MSYLNNSEYYFINGINSYKNKSSNIYTEILKNEYLYGDYKENSYTGITLKPETITLLNKKIKIRNISKNPYKILSTNMIDNFYSSVIDWSKHGIIAAGIHNSVFLYNNGISCNIYKNKTINSVKFNENGDYLAFGTKYGSLYIYDIRDMKIIHYLKLSYGIISLAWNGNLLLIGTYNNLLLYDTITKSEISYFGQNPHNTELPLISRSGHKSKICVLKWSRTKNYFSSGGDDNKVFIWSPKMSHKPIVDFTFKAAVKAMDWSPHNFDILGCGGGTNDRTIKLLSFSKSKSINEIYTGSQVCNLLWSDSVDEFITTHGYSNNEIICWKGQQLIKTATLYGHKNRVLYACLSQTGDLITGSAKSIRFWKIFSKKKPKLSPVFLYYNRQHIR